MKTNFLKNNSGVTNVSKIRNVYGALPTRGFTIGLALIIVASVLLISFSISSTIIRDIKLGASNENSSIAYNLAEASLGCVSNLDKVIRYYDANGLDLYGVLPISNAFTYVKAKDSGDLTPATAGFAGIGYDVTTTASNNFYELEDIKCFGVPILSLINTPVNDGSGNTVTLSTSPNGPPSPLNFYSAFLTEITIKKDAEDQFRKYLNNACVKIKVYTKQDVISQIHKRFLIAEASVPCEGSVSDRNTAKRVLIKFIQ